MNLSNVANLMNGKLKNEDLDSYAVFVKIGNEEKTIYSNNVNGDTLFDIASCGKVLITTPLILRAIGEGLISLETTLAQLFDEVPDDKKNITVKQLLTHTSGIVRYEFPNGMDVRHEMVTKDILSKPLAYVPGSNYRYSCHGMLLLGFILEKIYGESLENLFEKYHRSWLDYTRSKFNMEHNESNSVVCYKIPTADHLEHPWDDENVRVLKTTAGSGGQAFSLNDINEMKTHLITELIGRVGKELH